MNRNPIVTQVNNGMGTTAIRPVSNISNQSSQSQRSMSPNPLVVHPMNVMNVHESKSLNHFNGAQASKYVQIHANTNMSPLSLGLQKQSISKLGTGTGNLNLNQSSQHRINPLPSPHIDMRTSDVRVVYQRGSYSPNEEKSKQHELPLSPNAIEN